MIRRLGRALGQYALPLQVGALFVIRGQIAGVEVFDSQHAWRRQVPKLIRSYGLDALDVCEPVTDSRTPREFVAALASVPATETPALGACTDIRLQSPDVVGAALVADGRLVHAVAFPSDSTAVR